MSVLEHKPKSLPDSHHKPLTREWRARRLAAIIERGAIGLICAAMLLSGDDDNFPVLIPLVVVFILMVCWYCHLCKTFAPPTTGEDTN